MQLINLIPLTILASAAVAVPTEPSIIAYEAPTVGLNDTELEVSKRGLNGEVMRQIRVCTDANNRGHCVTQFIKANGLCYDLHPLYNDQTSYFWTNRAVCYLFKDGACNMQSPWRRVDAPGVSDMKTIGFNDVMSSFRCQYYTVI
ncbi:hypothetical protein BKCO1_4400030 [Neofusicoccum parvum]|nr:hypothetical protein BKCO1_4400030 [Neofusicoccum parvum]